MIVLSRTRLAGALTAGLVALSITPSARAAGSSYDVRDPSTWSSRQLAAQLTFSCVAAHDLARARRHAAAGIGGVMLLGNTAPRDLKTRLAGVRSAAPSGVAPFIASDEEGGTVQRLRYRIYRLPSAKTMGTWSSSRVRSTSGAYARRMRDLGVTMSFAPVADLAVRGYYIDSLRRGFSADPDVVDRKVRAWRLGLQDARVVPVIKHWPGHGQARDSHTGPARVPRLEVLERRDLVPFDRELARGAPAVMVGHLQSAGLTERGTPASESRRALTYLRARAGPKTVIITDSLSMSAASASLGISERTAAVRALRAGADWALVCSRNTAAVVDGIRAAIAGGRIPRSQAIASARRILALKEKSALLSRSR